MTSSEKSILNSQKLKLIEEKASNLPTNISLNNLDKIYENLMSYMHDPHKDYSKSLCLALRYQKLFQSLLKTSKLKLQPGSKYYQQNQRINKIHQTCMKKVLESESTEEAKDNCNNTVEELTLPETPTNEPITDSDMPTTVDSDSLINNDFISCLELYELLKKPDEKFLIIDIRPTDEYDASRISTDKCVNIPASNIKSGIIASHFEKYFNMKNDFKSLKLFERRHKTFLDKIILVDLSCNDLNSPEADPLKLIKKILTEWEPKKERNPISLILKGGFAEWFNTYPTRVTDPKVLITNSTLDDDTDMLNLTDITELYNTVNGKSDMKLERNDNLIDRSKKPSLNFNLHQINNYDSASNETFKNTKNYKTAISSVQRLSINNNNNYSYNGDNDDDDDEKYYKRLILSSRETRNPKITPMFDRSNKPTTIISTISQNNNTSDSKKLYSLLEEINLKSKDLIDFQSKAIKKEKEIIFNLTTKCNSDDVPEKEKEIAILDLSINEFEKSLNQMKENYKELRDNIIKNNSDILVKVLEIESNLREYEETIITNFKERKILGSRIEEKKKEVLNKIKENNNIHYARLKPEGSTSNSSLKRSVSSPNLRKEDQIRPKVPDRSSKPVGRKETIERNNNKINRRNIPRIIDAVEDSRGIPGITGLKNLGNSCYMNSIIQCLSNTPQLADYFIANDYCNSLNKNSDNESQGEVATQFGVVIKNLWRGEYKYFTPHALKFIVGSCRSEFDSHEQQDSHEFLTFFLEWMHNDLKKPMNNTLIKASLAAKEWNKSLENYSSIISDLFYGQLKSSVVCSTCQHQSVTYETFNCLSISLPESNKCHLNDCIINFLSGQKITGWACPTCKAPRDAIKKFDFEKLSPILVIHLNRFSGTDLGLEKKNTHVIFPLIGLNLNQYLERKPDDYSNSRSKISYNYNLYALSIHQGTMGGGHYTAFCKHKNKNSWYCYDDQKVTDIDESSVRMQNSTAYLLFYSISNISSA